MPAVTAPAALRRVVQLELLLWPPYPGPDYPTLPQYQSGLSHPARIWFRGAVWEFVQGSGVFGVVEYREVGR